ncbi:MAG: hypothetical protein KJ058_02005 [Thermoanaerobaculia bacterium]|nr:hypothetical protein [Thermoanaerobaculia bacterium]
MVPEEEAMAERSPYEEILDEENQSHRTRQDLFSDLEQEIGLPVVTFFTSFDSPVGITHDDVDMLQGVLQEMDLSRGLALVISSPGGDGLAAEALIKVCRSYSGTGGYEALVPGRAKSAATMICLGAERIVMGPASELGPVDPQVPIPNREGIEWLPAYDIVQSYEDLFTRCVAEKGNLEPYLQQLGRFEAQKIQGYRMAIGLADDIAVKALGSGMFAGDDPAEIKKRIAPFLNPAHKLAHGRAIDPGEATSCGLTVEVLDVRSRRWQLLYTLGARTKRFVSKRAFKCIETRRKSFAAYRGASHS